MKGVYQRPKVLIQNLRFKHAYLCVMNEAYSFLSSILKQAPPPKQLPSSVTVCHLNDILAPSLYSPVKLYHTSC